ncbi:MAG TPA: nuclear transport factor 2 family protein [Solirubrobacteraceae bacterium]|jgi:ketosteroid isomerase-like protein|nr:nuclear transport factor 2 family protein [Solirubrobacteraceae bacterium]
MSEEYAISPENIVRGLFEAASRRDFGTALDAFDQNVVMVVVPDAFPTAAGTYLGREEVGKWFAEWFRSFADDYRFEVEELRSVAERVFVVARHHGRGRASGVEVRGLFAYVYTVRLAKIVRVEIFRDRDEALDALGREK